MGRVSSNNDRRTNQHRHSSRQHRHRALKTASILPSIAVHEVGAMRFRVQLKFTDERGSGIISTAFGAVMFLSFVALAAHTLIGLYASSVVTSVAWDQARLVANDPDDPAVVTQAEANLRDKLGSLNELEFDWITNSDSSISLHVHALRPSLLPASLASQSSITSIDRTVTVRSERPQ